MYVFRSSSYYDIAVISIIIFFLQVNSFYFNQLYHRNNIKSINSLITLNVNKNIYPGDFLGKVSYLNDLWSNIITSSRENNKKSIVIDSLPQRFESFLLHNYFIDCQNLGALQDFEILHKDSELKLSLDYIKNSLSYIKEEKDVQDRNSILMNSKKWVQAMISDYSICPFTSSANKAGIPKGNIYYELSNAKTMNEAIKDFWQVTNKMILSTEMEISTVLLIYTNTKLFEDFNNFDLLSQNLELLFDETNIKYNSLEFSNYISNVYFHPKYNFKDKDDQVILVFDDVTGDIIGTSDQIVEPISFSRRSPYPMVNILRSSMVKSAQRSLPEGKIFYMNIDRLNNIGSKQLQVMLDNKDWSQLPKISSYTNNNSNNNHNNENNNKESTIHIIKNESENTEDANINIDNNSNIDDENNIINDIINNNAADDDNDVSSNNDNMYDTSISSLEDHLITLADTWLNHSNN